MYNDGKFGDVVVFLKEKVSNVVENVKKGVL